MFVFSSFVETIINKARNMVIFSEFWVCIFFRNACIFATAKRRNDSLRIINLNKSVYEAFNQKYCTADGGSDNVGFVLRRYCN